MYLCSSMVLVFWLSIPRWLISIHGDPNLMLMPLLCRTILVESLHRSFVSPMMMMMLLMGRSANYNFLVSSFQQTILGTPSLLLKWWCRFYTGQSYRLVLAVTNGISKTASLHCVVFSWLGFLSCESGTDIVPCEFRIVVVESSYNRYFFGWYKRGFVVVCRSHFPLLK